MLPGHGHTLLSLLTPAVRRSQVKDFIVDGYLVITPDDVPGGREQFASSFYDKARSIAGPESLGSDYRSRDETLWEALTPEVNAVLGSPTTHGALTSLLGPDFIGPPGNSLMHVSQQSDQTYHKDGTDHGPTMSTVRDHRCRHVIVMFYPIATTLDLGPTSVLPTTQYSSVDRAGFHNSEERLSPFMRPPKGEDARLPAGRDGYWQRASATEAEFTQGQSLEEQDAARLSNAVELLGDPSLEEHKVCVPAGSVVICHIDLWHRASRRTAEADWRPMFAIRSVSRVSDPSGPTAALWQQQRRHSGNGDVDVDNARQGDEDPFSHVVGAPPEYKVVWQEMWDYMCGTSTARAATVALPKPDSLERQVLHSNCEMARLGAAYQLGRLVAAAEPEQTTASDHETRTEALTATAMAALGALRRLLLDPAEATRRSAAYGLTAAGPAALPWLNSLLRSPAALESLPRDPQPNVDVQQGVIVQIVHAVAHCATAAAASAAVAADTVSAVHTAMRRAVAEIESQTAAATAEELAEQEPHLHNMYQNEVPLNFHVIERRRTIAEGCVALGLIGANAVADGRESTAEQACAALVEVASRPEPGLAWAAFMTRASVVHNAALGLVRLASDLGSSGAALPAVHTGGGWADENRRDYHNASILQGMVQEARRRGAQRLGEGGLHVLQSTAALERVLRQIEEASWPWAESSRDSGSAGEGGAAVVEHDDPPAPPAEWSSYLVLQ